ncbi:uncharacterized protein CDAR_455131 [Caerostris darwini]|uniref:Uncharacterized protein n=1 Tax=Caerostris darwini TaxID=1538125 RepID=A0AAV4RBC8_9ARAC|nr:uncharacterized protein CDAR_455131 [Caerostris darwini]
MRYFVMNIFFLWLLLFVLSESSPTVKPHPFSKDDSREIKPRQLGPLGLTILGALTLPILIPVGVARLVSRLTNLGNSTTSTGVTLRPVILPGRPLRLPNFRSLHERSLRKRRTTYDLQFVGNQF